MITQRVKDILKDETTPGTVLITIFADKYGMEALEWDPETIHMELEELLGSKMPPAPFNKLMAAIEVTTSDSFYRDLPSFIRLCNALYDGTLHVGTFDPADAAEIAWGVAEALMLWPPLPSEQKPFDEKIVGYIQQALRDEGLARAPGILSIGNMPMKEYENVQESFADDPVMFQAITELERAKVEAIEEIVQQRLALTITLFAELNLDNGNAIDAAKNLQQMLMRASEDRKKLRPV